MNNLDIKYNFKDGAKWDLPVYLNRQNPIPLDGTSIYNSYAEAEAYARENAKAYPGQIISVVTDTEVKVYKINNGKLEELGKGSLVTDQNPKLLAKADNIGQIIYLTTQVQDGEDTYSPGPYIVSGAGTVSKIGTTSASGDIAGDVATLQGKVSTLEQTVGVKGSGSDNPSTGLVKDVEDLKSEDTKLAGQINTLSGKVDKIKVEKLNTAESESFAATYKFTDAAGNTVNINIPKDQFLKGVTYVADKPEPAEGNSADIEFPALRFEWQLSEQAVTYVSVKSLVDNYGIATDENYLKKDTSNNFYIDFVALKTAIIGSENTPDSVLGKIKAATDNAAAAKTTADDAKSAADAATEKANTATSTANTAKTTAESAVSTANNANTTAEQANTKAVTAQKDATDAKSIANTAKTTADAAKAAADANTKTLEGHTASITDLAGKVTTNTSNIATNAGNIAKNAGAIAANTTAINKNTEAIGTQAVVTPANIHIVGEPEQPVAPEGGTATAEYFLADGAGKPVTANDIKEGGTYYIYKRETIKTPDLTRPDEFNTTIRISLVRQADAGEGKDFTYPSITTHSTGLYQYIDNHIKNFDLSWQILD